ncbi:MAG: methyltransferase domain-containing protein [Spirochaetaceae bacterium]|jgi:2-polyprenyl-3-methyl-5-hydroxy-6-metoxy-1,4-benzoquinol methylase|nr:methyltransferase domain-containing protein [Spirochaetaceae bacterium]
MNAGRVLVIPALEKGRGGGHLIRSLTLVRALRSLGGEACLYLPVISGERVTPDYPGAVAGLAAGLVDSFNPAWIMDAGQKPEEKKWDLIVVDRFKTSLEEFRIWSAWSPLVGLDEGGVRRDRFDFLLDLLPGPPGIPSPNMTSPELLPLPKNRRPSFFTPPCTGEGPVSEGALPPAPFRILVSFGAEDPAELSLAAVQALVNPPGVEITLVVGSLHKNPAALQTLTERSGLRVLKNIGELREKLAGYDLLVTHFGLTAFEALYARVPVLLAAPGPYHKRLGRRGGFVSVGTGKKEAARLARFLYTNNRLDPQKLYAVAGACEKIARRYNLEGERPGDRARDLARLLREFTPIPPDACPVCGKGERRNHRVLDRFPRRTYRSCPHCGMVYMLRLSKPSIEYETDYFFGAYKRQYGKTYLEDFPSLVKTGKIRLKHIRALLPRAKGGTPRLLDLGCAYGPFLAAARDGGFSPVGMDPVEDAIRYVRDELGFPAFQGFFPESPPEFRGQDFEVITLWYVIEHFEAPRRVLMEINRLLKPGGVLAFATPSFGGISRLKSRKKFLEKSPADHWTLWSPRRCGKILKSLGFRVKKIRITGHHPERFPLIGPFLTKKTGPVYSFFYGISVIFGLGDTFEVYAIKNKRRGP